MLAEYGGNDLIIDLLDNVRASSYKQFSDLLVGWGLGPSLLEQIVECCHIQLFLLAMYG